MAFTFTNDKSGTLTKSVDSSAYPQVEASVAQGAASVSFASGVKMKKFLHAVQVKGMRVGGDIEITDGGELFLSDGTAASSLIKEVDLVFGKIVAGEFVFLDPSKKFIDDLNAPESDAGLTESLNSGSDSDYGALNLEEGDAALGVQGDDVLGKWYLRLVRPNAEVEYKEFKAINDLMEGLGGSGEVFSILGAMKEVRDLQDAIRTVIDAAQLASQADVDALETKVDADISSLATFLGNLETQLVNHMAAGDGAVVDFLDARIAELETSFNDIHNAVRLHGEATIDIDSENPAGTDVTFETEATALLDLLGEEAHDIKKWMIDVGVVEIDVDGDVRRNDIDTSWTAVFTVENKLEITGSLETIGADIAGTYKMVVNAIWCGAQPVLSANAEAATISLPVYDSLVEDLTLNTGSAADSDTPGTKIATPVPSVTNNP